MKFRFLLLAALVLVLLTACSLAADVTPPPDYQSPTPGPTMSPLFPAAPPDLAAGATIFVENCAPCHGDQGLGDGPMASKLQKQPVALGKPEIARAAAPANWYTTVTQGNIQSFMPPFNAKLSDAQRWDVVAYALSLGTAGDNGSTQGQALYDANCAQCHGPGGKADPKADFTDQALMAKLTQTDLVNFMNKGLGTMPSFGGKLSDVEVYAVAAYVRSFTFSSDHKAAAAATPGAPTPTLAPETTSVPTPEGTPAAAGTPAEITGTIGGKVVNGSGGTLPADLTAVLHIFEHDATTQQFSEVSSQKTQVGADGTYSFGNVSMPSNRAFYVSVDYSNSTYESDPAIPAQDKTTKYDLPITIYDTTTDTSTLSTKQAHIVLDYSKPDMIQVVEFYVITNTGKKTVVAADQGGPIVKMLLPAGYSNLQFEQGSIGDRFLKTEDGFADTTSVAPGAAQYQIVFAFDLPLPKAGLFGATPLEFSQPLSLPAEAVSVLIPEGITLKADGFTAGTTQDMGNGAKYQVYSAASAFEAGKVITISASGTPKSGAPIAATTPNSTQNIIYGVGAFGVALILVGGWLYWRNSHHADEEDEDLDEDEESGPAEDTAEIMDAIVTLDDQFKAGNISETAYQERRAELKAKLKANL